MLNSAEHEIYHAIDAKLEAVFGILTFISMLNTTSEILEARKAKKFHILTYGHFKVHVQLSCMNKLVERYCYLNYQWFE